MRYLIRSIQVLTFAIVLSSCSTPEFRAGSDFNVTMFSEKVERGITTENEVRAWLGSPTSTGIQVETNGERYVEWTYYFAVGSLSNLRSTQLKILQIKFDKQGIVKGYNWSTSTP